MFSGLDILATRSAPHIVSPIAGVSSRAAIRFPTPHSRLPTPGFTLIEILVVVVILGILAAIVVPRVMERPAEARIVRVKQDLQGVNTALSMYKLDNHRYPSSEQGLQALTAKPSGQPEAPNWKGPYLDRLPKDPWEHPYQYQQPGQHGDVDIYSYGADGRPGGDGDDADIGNWDN
ncbi:MAG: type II secretion system major pseudopilin GspG [Xanthomonadales bacterium]|nr:type II secretion system major pseudopilin GspG [Xanthomonadales bacterium]